MARDQLKQTLHELHDELGRSGQFDAEDRAALTQTLKEIQDLLNRKDAQDDGSLNDRVSREIERFEGSHPEVATLLARISGLLSNLGI